MSESSWKQVFGKLIPTVICHTLWFSFLMMINLICILILFMYDYNGLWMIIIRPVFWSVLSPIDSKQFKIDKNSSILNSRSFHLLHYFKCTAQNCHHINDFLSEFICVSESETCICFDFWTNQRISYTTILFRWEENRQTTTFWEILLILATKRNCFSFTMNYMFMLNLRKT